MKNKSLVAAATAAVLGTAIGGAQAASTTLMIDPTGGGGANAANVIDVTGLDWLPGNAVAEGGNNLPFVDGLPPNITPDGAHDFTVYAHAALSNFTFNNVPVVAPAGSEQFTFVTGFGELGELTGSNSAAFTFDPANPINYFEIWAGGADANDLLGSGFNDGDLVLTGTIIDADGSFAVDLTTVPFFFDGTANPAFVGSEDLDQFLGDDWSGQQSAAGTGGTEFDLTIAILSLNPAYILNDNLVSLDAVFDTQQNLPFDQTDPSECFVDAAGGVGSSSCDNVFDFADANGFNPSVGPINSAFDPDVCNDVDTCDVLFLADANMTFTAEAEMPEPGSLALVGLGMAGLGAMRRRQKKRSA